MRAPVLGGYGAVGTQVAAQLRADGDDGLVAGRDPARADRVVDLHQPGATTYRTQPGPIDIALLVGAGERHGAAATAWSYRLLGRRFRDPDGRLVRNYTRPRRVALPGWGRRRLYRADFSDQHALSRDLGVPVRTHFGLDSRVATTLLAGLTWIPGRRGRRGACTCRGATGGWRLPGRLAARPGGRPVGGNRTPPR